MTIKGILVGPGGTEYTPLAIRRTFERARRHRAESSGVTVLDGSRLRDVGPVPVGGAHGPAPHPECGTSASPGTVTET